MEKGLNFKPFYIMLRIKLYKMPSCMELFKRKEKGLEKNSKPLGPLGHSSLFPTHPTSPVNL